ncbi:PIN domain-containing protein [Corynebacterium durum]|uniref:DUF4935 domain-containing protein n=1 Tax=Corynebacterium durum F0235 TaxID=1035195 RepID=L1MH32_9CORY|nr:PIN domain-containing protein [Corynebacterium durum]EKX90249.1 hypothetical protein HMPREF9997_01464 [Corynebacterium durum F0235]
MTTIFIDSTETTQNLGLKTANWRKLLEISERENINIVIPEVVAKETLRKWKSRYDQNVRKLNSLQHTIKTDRDNLDWNLQNPSPEDDGENSEPNNLPIYYYNKTPQLLNQEIFEQYLRSLGIKIAPLPKTPIGDILSRELENKKPFEVNERGFSKGFRDTLIWETIKEHIRNNEASRPFYFVSNNSTDFADNERKLIHSTLLEELRTEGLAEVKWVPSLSELFETIESIKSDTVSDNKYTDNIEDELNTKEETHKNFYIQCIDVANREILWQEINLPDKEYHGGVDIENLYLPPEIETARIDSIETDPDSLEINIHEELEGDEILFDANIDASITFFAYIYKADQYMISDKELEEYDLCCTDTDHNRHYAEYSGQFEARIQYQAYANPSQENINSIELQNIRRIEYR